MNPTLSLASLKASPDQSVGSGMPIRIRTNTANDIFGQLLESAVFRPRVVRRAWTEALENSVAYPLLKRIRR